MRGRVPQTLGVWWSQACKQVPTGVLSWNESRLSRTQVTSSYFINFSTKAYNQKYRWMIIGNNTHGKTTSFIAQQIIFIMRKSTNTETVIPI